MKKPIKNVPKDKAVFKHTAKKTKRINVAPVLTRGGIRL